MNARTETPAAPGVPGKGDFVYRPGIYRFPAGMSLARLSAAEREATMRAAYRAGCSDPDVLPDQLARVLAGEENLVTTRADIIGVSGA